MFHDEQRKNMWQIWRLLKKKKKKKKKKRMEGYIGGGGCERRGEMDDGRTKKKEVNGSGKRTDLSGSQIYYIIFFGWRILLYYYPIYFFSFVPSPSLLSSPSESFNHFV